MEVKMNAFCLTTITVILVCTYQNNAFNLSPKPSVVFREPPSAGMHKMRSSYFGFSLTLKRNSVFVGAPRAQSTLDAQKGINETGAIYKCRFDKSAKESCTAFVFDFTGNGEEDNNRYTYNNEMKDHQWLGASMDGGPEDSDKFVVCAPRISSNLSTHYLLHGICYWTQNTSSDKPRAVQKISPLRLIQKQSYIQPSDKSTQFYYMYGQQGISVHITERNEEILIGAPGIYTWKGSVIRHRRKTSFDSGDLSRRIDSSILSQQTRSESMEYSSDIPNPFYWNKEKSYYFGYAVSSGYFDGIGKTKLLYVASAPQSNFQQGAVYIFDIVDHFSGTDKTIKIYHTFPGQQLGEYFGYSLITEDFDSDGLTDIAISAPYYSKTGNYENGAVYIYKNEGTSSNFVLHAVLQTDYEFNGRFGTTLSKVGDINQDGYNDLLVGAPFEENGAVYIYHGSSNGLPIKPTQRIVASPNGFAANAMFGHGLSKGADIDGNHYLDIAVGSPNAEAVYIYKSYPVIRINTSITPVSQEIQTTDKSFKFEVCWSFESKYPIGFDVFFNATIKLDGQFGRALFKDNQNEYKINGNITSADQCTLLEASVSFSVIDIFRPIELEMTHHVQNGMPSSDNDAAETQDFCDKCVAIDPNDSNTVRNKIVFSTGCKSARCIADLKVKSSLENIPSLPYVLGSSSSLTIVYNVKNKGETAYLAQIRITLPENGVFFSKIPSNCKTENSSPTSNVMECDLNNGRPIYKDGRISMKISVDTTKLDGSQLVIGAGVYSTGDELNELDNIVEDVIPLKEFSNIEVFGDSIKNRITIEDDMERENLTHIFEIRNNGPSNIKSLDIFVNLPVSYLNPWTLEREELIDISSISIKSVHNGQSYDVEWVQNKPIVNDIDSSTLSLNAPFNDYTKMQFDSSKRDLEYDLSQPSYADSSKDNFVGHQKRRSIEPIKNTHFSPYLQKVIETDEMTPQLAWKEKSLNSHRNKVGIFSSNDRLLANLPSNRTTYFDCQDAEQKRCIQGKFTVTNLQANDLPIMITLNFAVDLIKVANIMTEMKDIFVIQTSVNFEKTAEEDTSSLKVTQNQPFTIISKNVKSSTLLWVWIISIIVGIFALILITYGLYRFGFFKRGTRDELVKLRRESNILSYYPLDNNYNCWVIDG